MAGVGGKVVLCGNSISDLSKPCIPCWMRGRGSPVTQRKGSSRAPSPEAPRLQGGGLRARCHRCVFLEKLISIHSSRVSSLEPTCSFARPGTPDWGVQPFLNTTLIFMCLQGDLSLATPSSFSYSSKLLSLIVVFPQPPIPRLLPPF